MKKKKLSSIIVIALGVLSYFFSTQSGRPVEQKANQAKVNSLNIALTKHARCRMDCRQIDMSEIKLALSDGSINHRKSEPNKKPCPVFAREVYSQKDKQRIRVVSADCKNESTIITVIDLSRDHQCFCK